MKLTQNEINAVLAQYPGAPSAIVNHSARVNWARWRAILDRITSNRHYRFEDPQKFLLLKMAAFASDQMAHYHHLMYGE